MNDSFPHPIYHNLPPSKITKGPHSFQNQGKLLKNPVLNDQSQQDLSGNNISNELTQSSLSSSSSSDDLVEREFEEYQKVLRNRTKAIRDEYTLTRKLKKKDKPVPLTKKIISKNIIDSSKVNQSSDPSENLQKKTNMIPERSISQNQINSQQNYSIRIPNGHISNLSSNYPYKSSSLTPTFKSKSEYNSNFNSKSIHDPFDNSYIRSLDSNQNSNLNDPKLNITGQSLVGASISHVRPQKISTFEDRQVTNLNTCINWIKFRANPVKKPKPYVPPISKEDQYLKHLMSEEGLKEARKKSEALELLRQQAKANQKIPDYNSNAVCTSIESTQTKEKVKVISKTMAINDF
ncbi:hypothetical protein M9Y10_013115 [Tritrichomonas musculus]|uniref:Uncharacterized protein n=1 Tax=Tritrichomonas musculus TaxID=1915356 RepID=A0ABR2I6I7_9EUKA